MKKLIALTTALFISFLPMPAQAEEVAVPVSITEELVVGPAAEYEFRNQAPIFAPKPMVRQQTLASFSPSNISLSARQITQVTAAVNANAGADKFICTGIRFEGQSAQENLKVRQRAKAACDLAKTLNPSLSTWFQSKTTKVASFNGRVLLTVKTPVVEISTLATCSKGVNERLIGTQGTNGNYICVEPVFSAEDDTKISSLEVKVLDASGENCEGSSNPDCTGYYIGWRMNFSDDDRQVSYDGATTIAGLQPGDAGVFQLMYQQTEQTVFVDITLRDSTGEICSDANPDCVGYYIGWDMNFSDLDREVSYQPGTRISGLLPGDSGSFQLRYQSSPDSDAVTVALYEFSYQPGSSVITCGEVARETLVASTVTTNGNYVCAVLGANRVLSSVDAD